MTSLPFDRLAPVLVAIAATPLAAQSPPPTRTGTSGDIVVTASRSGEGVQVGDLPASITLLGENDLRERQTRLVSDVLRDVPGLAVGRAGAVGGFAQVRVRGAESNHVLVLIDGIEASDPFYGEFDFATLPADEAARVEVLRGQQSSLYGSDAVGGVIHYITPTGRERPGVSLRAEGGSSGTAAGGARVAGFGDTLDYAVSASAYHTDGYPTARSGVRDVGATLANATAKVSWTPSDRFKLTGVGRYGHIAADTNDTALAGPLFGYVVDSPGTRYRNDAVYGLVRADLSLADGRWNSALIGQVADTRRTGFAGGARIYGSEGRRYKGTLQTGLSFGTRAVSRVTGTIDYEREEFRNTARDAFTFNGRRATENWGLVGQYELTVDDALSAGASIRRDENDRFAETTTWRVQAGYRLPNGLRLRGAYGTGVKNPGYYELFGYLDGRYIGNPGLKPETSKGWEAGADWRVADGRATLGATWFDSRLEDEVFVTFPAPAFVATPANRTTRSKQHGLEAFISARPIPQLSFDLAYTWLKSTEDGVREVRRPRHVGSGNVTVLSGDRRLSATLTVRYNGRQTDLAYTDPSFVPVRVALREYVLVNLSAEYRLNERLSLFGRIENLAEERYEEVFSTVAPGRTAYGGVRARF